MRVLALAGLLPLAACMATAGGDGAATAPFPDGSYGLINDLVVTTRPAEPAEVGYDGFVGTFRIGDEREHPVSLLRPGVWVVPELDLELSAEGREEDRLLRLTRYQETVLLAPAGPGNEVDYAGWDRRAVIAHLVPRLMIAFNVPGVSVALVEEGEVRWLGQHGVKVAGGEDRVDASTIFEAASMSKPAYGYAVLGLAQDGILDLDRSLVEYLGADYLEGEELHRTITARMVLSHTTGFPNWRRGGELEVRFLPGSRIGYSGEGFLFLQTAVEAVTGLPTERFAQERLLRPLGMTASSYEWQERYDDRYATGHSPEGRPREWAPYQSANTAYTLYTTPADYARLLVEMLRPNASGPYSLSPEWRRTMLTSQVQAEERQPVGRRGEHPGATVHFVLGWRMDRLSAGPRYYHSGSNSTGFQCYSEFDPATGSGIVIMTNSSSGSPLWRALLREIG